MSDDRPETDNLLDLLYPDGQDPARLERLRRSVEADPQARERLRGYEEVRRIVAELPVPEPERAVHYEILRQARAAAAEASAGRTSGGFFAWLAGLQLGPVLAGALGLLLAVGGTLMLTREDALEAAPPASASVSAEAPTAASPAAQVARPQVMVSKDEAPAEEAKVALGAAPAPASEPQPAGTTWMNAPASTASARVLAEGGAEKASARSTGARGGDGFAAPEGDKRGADGPVGRQETETAADPFPSGGGGAAAERKANGFAPPPKVAEAAPREPAFEPTPRNPVDEDDGIIGGVAPRADVVSKNRAPEPAGVESPVGYGTGAPGAGEAAAQSEARREASKPVAKRPAEERRPRAESAESSVDDLLGATRASPQPVQAAAAVPPPPAAAASPTPAPVPAPARPASPAKKGKSAAFDDAAAALDSETSSKTRDQAGDARDPLALARVARKVQQWRVAVRHYQDYLDRIPEAQRMPAVLFETADAYERAGDTGRALELYRLVARSGGPQAGPAEKRIAALEAARNQQAAPPKAKPQAAPASIDEFEAEPAAPAERK